MARKSNAPPQMVILLWHHFCYYKRHKIKLAITMLMPFIFLFGCFALDKVLTDGTLKYLFHYGGSRGTPESPMSAGPLAHYLGQGCPRYPEQVSMNDNERSTLDKILRYNGNISSYIGRPDCGQYSNRIRNLNFSSEMNRQRTKRQTNDECWDFRCKSFDSNQVEEDPICVVIRHRILFYPNTSATVRQVMSRIATKVDDFYHFYADLSVNQVPQIFKRAQRYTPCALPAGARIIGFETKDQVVDYTKELSGKQNESVLYVPYLWGVVGFDTPNLSSTGVLKYTLVRDSSPLVAGKESRQFKWLQDLVDDALITLHKKSEVHFSLATNELPTKCWYVPDALVYGVLFLVVPIVGIISFQMAPVNFLYQVLVEKRLKLREYLYIMGVGSFQLKFSWILFYMLFLIPLSIVFAIVIYYYPGPTFGRTNFGLLFFTLILFNIAQLCFCYMVAAFLNSEKRTTTLIVFLNVFFLILASNLFNQASITGGTLVLARITSLHPCVPIKIAFSYLVTWEQIWLGAQWKTLLETPMLDDQYGGLGECLLWLIGDSILYLVIAWYCEHAIPGDYGVKEPFYFPFLPSFWFPNAFKKQFDVLEAPEAADVEPVEGKTPGVMLSKVSKHYTRDKVGINQLTLTFYQNEVTAFLGENGAGKSTTMNTLVGLISATGGKAEVMGLDTHTQIDDVRKIIGFVPQYDILYPSMTVEEHLQFFGWLKGMSLKEIKIATTNILQKLNLTDQRHSTTTTLSGGQKRKLSIMTAYLGDPQVIILDEPTSGVDPFSKRAIWDMVLAKRRQATTILSTHFMQEADILGDRVAIISTGELKCSGTPMYLKTRYGHGFRLIVACDPQFPKKAIVKAFVKQCITGSKLKKESGSDLTFTIPPEFSASDEMVMFLKNLEDQQAKLSVVSYGLSEPTMEEVFFTATDNISKPKHGDESPDSFSENGDGIQLMESTESNTETGQYQATSDQITFTTKNSGVQILEQAYAFFLKKIIITTFSWSGYVLQIGLPLAFVFLMLLIGDRIGSITDGTVRTVDIWQNYRTNKVFFQANANANDFFKPYITSTFKNGLGTKCQEGNKCSSSAAPIPALLSDPPPITVPTACDCDPKKVTTDYCTSQLALDQPHQNARTDDIIYRVSSNINYTSTWVTFANESTKNVIGGFQHWNLDSNKWNAILSEWQKNMNATWVDRLRRTTKLEYVTIWYKKELELAVANIWTNFALKQAASSDSVGLDIRLEQLRLTDLSNNLFAQIIELVQILYSTVFLDFAFAFGTFGIVIFVQYENSSGLKRLQLLYGANPLVYWLVHLVFDFILFLITMALVLLFLGTIKNTFQDYLAQITLAVIPYGFMAITFTYLLSFTSRTSKGIVIFIVVSSLVFFFAALIMAVFEIMTTICDAQRKLGGDCDTFVWAGYVSDVLRIFPSYFIADSLLYISLYPALERFTDPAIQALNPFGDIYSFQMLGKRMLTGWLVGVVYFVASVLLEYFDVTIDLCGCCKNRYPEAANPLRVMDEDVVGEEARVHNSSPSDPLIVKGLSKTYRGMTIPAVAGVTFSVPQSQCFGLLGINGAGKSTLFRMLTGYQRNSNGTAMLEGKDMFKSRGWSGKQGSSYCPQENTLFENLTARQHLNLFATIRGIPGGYRKDVIDCLVKEVGLTPHLSKRAGQLSGGNQRKLQFAMSLLDYRSVIFMDEPTTGMDPGARRNAWRGIHRAVNKGCAVVLTSHSMEECEELCHRLVIMVAGSFQCIGSVQYLKDKFGNKYTFKLKLQNPDQIVQHDGNAVSSPAEAVKAYITGKYPSATLLEELTTMLHYDISATDTRLSDLFAVLSEARRLHEVEDFTVSQTTLENVFVNMARQQELLHAGLLQQVPLVPGIQIQAVPPPIPHMGTAFPVYQDPPPGYSATPAVPPYGPPPQRPSFVPPPPPDYAPPPPTPASPPPSTLENAYSNPQATLEGVTLMDKKGDAEDESDMKF